MTRLELTTGHARDVNSVLTEQNFGVSPLDQYSVPPSNRRIPIYTVPGIPKRLFNQLVEVAILEYAMAYEQEDLDYKTCKQYMPSLTSLDYDKIIKSPEFHTALVLRGVRKESEGLSGDQMRALSVMTDLSSAQSLEKKLKQAGITWYQWQTWMHSPLFKAHHDRLASKIFTSVQQSIDLRVATGALDGKLDFIKYYNELTGRHSPDRRAQQDVQMILNEVVAILQRNVRDPEVLVRISAELSAVVSKLG